MLHKTFGEMGIPPGYGFKRLLYSETANVIVLQTKSVENWRPERLHIRNISEERYHPIGADHMVSQEHPIISASRPLLAYNTLLHRFDVDAEGVERHGADWSAVRLYDLSLNREVATFDAFTTQFPNGVTRGWISRLLSFGNGSDTLHVVAGWSKDSQFTMDYHIAELHLQSGAVRPIALLPAVFM